MKTFEEIANQQVAYEYNEASGLFHENIGETKEDTNGYKTVCHTTYAEIDKFRPVKNVFVDILTLRGITAPTFEEVSKLWTAWDKGQKIDQNER